MASVRVPTIAALYEPQARWGAVAYRAGWVLAGSLTIGVAAQLAVPLVPVPVTMQTFAVLLIAAASGPGLAVCTILAYLAEGAIGLPVFSSGRSGLAALAGPTGGYLVGFAVAAWVVGYLAKAGWDRRFWTTLAAMAIGNSLIYGLGTGWLCMGWGMGPGAALRSGVYPFVAPDLLKALAAAWLLPRFWRWIGGNN